MADNCPDTGSIHNTEDPNKPYVAPDLCVGTYDLTQAGCDSIQEQYAQENLNISGATLNVFKLLGVHEQGKLVDIIGNGKAMNNSGNAFNDTISSWISRERGMNVLTAPSWIGYDFGFLKTSYGMTAYENPQPVNQNITSLRITQPTAARRATQIRIDNSDGDFTVNDSTVQYSITGNGKILNLSIGKKPALGTLMLIANNAESFSVFFTGTTTFTVGVANVNSRFMCDYAVFDLRGGVIPFAAGDMISIPLEMKWRRVDVVNLPNTIESGLVRFTQSKPSRYWRIVPTSFAGAGNNQPWEVSELEFYDYQATRLDDIQDSLFMENRDRDYAKQSVPMKAAYTAIDQISDLGKFGFQISDTYNFTTTFAGMVQTLGRPIVIGDIIEVPSELQYDQNLKPVRKFLEVVDSGWTADGRTTSWRPIIYKFQAAPFFASQEHRDILGTADTQKYVIDDSDFFSGLNNQIQTGPLTSTEINKAEADAAVPEKGINVTELASGAGRLSIPDTYDGLGIYVQDGIPPDGKPYTEGFKMPDITKSKEGDYFRLNYDPALNIPPRLFKFSLAKGKWIFVESDKRQITSSHKPSQTEIFNNTTRLPAGLKTLPKKT